MSTTGSTATITGDVDGLTPQQKAAQTKRERKERQEAAERACNADLPIALSILRQIRDNPAASGIEKIFAIALLADLSKR